MKYKFFNVRFWTVLQISVLVLISLLPIFWFSGNEIIFGPDSLWQLNYDRVAHNTIFLWKSTVSFGYGWSDVNSLPHIYLVLLLDSLHVPYPVIQKLIISLSIFVSALGAYLLFNEITSAKNKKEKTFGLLASIFYIVNPFALTWVWWRFLWVIYIYPVWPILFLFVVRAIKRKQSLTEITLFALVICFFSPGVGALVMSFILAIALVLFVVTNLLITKQNTFFVVKQLSIFAVIVLLLNSWWLVPGFLMISNSITNALTAYDPVLALKYTSTNSNVFNVMTLWGNRPLYDTFFGESYYGEKITDFIMSGAFPLFQGTFLIIIALAIFEVVTTKIIRLFYLGVPFVAIFIAGVFLSKGLNDPFGSINLGFLDLPLIGPAFRVPYDKFGYMMAISVSMLIPLGLYLSVQKKGWNFNNIFFTSSTIALIIILMSIAASPDFLPRDQEKLRGVVAVVPDEYKLLEELMLNSKDRVLVLPPANASESSYVWSKGVQPNGKDIIGSYLDASIIFLPNGNFYSDKLLKEVNSLFNGNLTGNQISTALSRIGINYILLHKDWNKEFMHNKVPPPEYYIDYIYELNGLSVVIDNDYFTLFNVAPYSQAERFRFTSSNIFSANNPSLRSSMVLREYVGEDITLLSSDRDALPDVYTIDVGNINSVSASFSEISFEGIIGPTNNLIIRNEVLPLIYQKQIQAVETTNNTSYKKVSLMPSNRNTLRVQNIATGTGILYEDPNMSYPEKWISQDWECTPKHPDKIRVKNKEIQIRSLRGNTVCFMIVLGQFSTSSQGVIQFAYKAEHGTNPKLLVTSEIEGGGLNIVYKEELLETEELIKKKITFPIAKNSRYRIFLFSENSLLTDKLLVFSDIAFGAIMPDLFSKIFVGANNVYQFNRSAASNEALVYKELNSTKYVISLINISRPGYIVSAMAYDKGWEISNNRTKNVLIDGYFNGWYIDPVELCGTKETLKEGCTINPDGSYNIDLVIEFTPQRWFYIGLIISGTTLLGCIGYLGYDFVRTRRLKKGEGVIG